MTNCSEVLDRSVSKHEGSVTRKPVYRACKRLADILFALPAIILLSLPMLIIALIIRLESPGKAIFCQKRVGQHGRLFTIYKFRSMYISAPSETPTGMLDDAQSHITRVGRFLRKTSLDELPQLLNLLKGDMSLIGPRPLIANEGDIHRMREEVGVYAVRPGLTGWAQINGRDNLSCEEKVRLDAEYVQRMSFGFDIRIILRSVYVIFSGDGFAEGKQNAVIDDAETADENEMNAE